jgi:hypothetical protein
MAQIGAEMIELEVDECDLDLIREALALMLKSDPARKEEIEGLLEDLNTYTDEDEGDEDDDEGEEE